MERNQGGKLRKERPQKCLEGSGELLAPRHRSPPSMEITACGFPQPPRQLAPFYCPKMAVRAFGSWAP